MWSLGVDQRDRPRVRVFNGNAEETLEAIQGGMCGQSYILQVACPEIFSKFVNAFKKCLKEQRFLKKLNSQFFRF